MPDLTQWFIRQNFQKYYEQNDIKLPPEFEKREWGFSLETGMVRHLAFNNSNEIKEYLVKHVPMHGYYSTAYYKNPKGMEGWLGADLIFDLDADHLADCTTYRQQINKIKDYTQMLLEEFLLAELGFKEEQIEIVFSGGRGYHIHVYDDESKQLPSGARKEIVDYLTGLGLDASTMIVKDFKDPDRRPASLTLRIDNHEHGWGKRLKIYLLTTLDDIKDLSNSEIGRKYGNFPSYKGKTPKELKLFANNKYHIKNMTEKGIISASDTGLSEFFKDLVKNDNQNIREKFGCLIDEPVTGDVKRLIRIPNTLHGKTALRVVSMDKKTFDDFDPMYDAVAFGNTPTKINIIKPVEMEMAGQLYRITQTGIATLPLNIAMYLICSSHATYIV